MEELHRAALAYYNNGDPNLRLLASNFFQSMDRNGDDIVNLAEFVTFLQQNGYGGLHTTTPASWITISCSDQREQATGQNASNISSIRGCNYSWKFDDYVYDYLMHAWMGRLINGQRLWPHKMFI
ncbi:hypothetical protein DVH24_010884 [Malus domestica]|uniref:EF-hand domain-containing protein n=1 Tax=Malus domestica TaxID=3750 RepID=A0A498JRJ6_MALDO|nr:hypothetical protein DVH24_010884 [Malus domestica]